MEVSLCDDSIELLGEHRERAERPANDLVRTRERLPSLVVSLTARLNQTRLGPAASAKRRPFEAQHKQDRRTPNRALRVCKSLVYLRYARRSVISVISGGTPR